MAMGGEVNVKEEHVVKAAGYERADSTGYRNAMKELKNLGYVEKSSKMVRLTEKGLEYAQEKYGDSNQNFQLPTTNQEVADHYKAKILKFSKGKVPALKLDAIWNVLSDMKPHERDELLAAADYKRPDSTGYREIMKWIKKFELVASGVTTKTSFQFVAEKITPFSK